MKLLVTAGAVMLLSCTALALDVAPKKAPQPEKPQEQATDKKTQETQPAKPKPSPEMKKLARLINGRWQVEEKYEVTPLTPQGGEGKGVDVIHRGPGALSIINNYNSVGTLGEYHAAGIITWSPEEGAFMQFWVDDGAPGGKIWQGKFDGDSLVLTNVDNSAGRTTHWRQSFAGFTTDSFTVTLDMGSSDTDLKRFMSMRFTRLTKQGDGMRRHGMGMHGRPNYDSWGSPRAGLR